MKHLSFEDAYKSLNRGQREAVDTIEGPVMVIAGPGTGKTQILTLRIANILKRTDTPPESILALTFTESGARAMRDRLSSYIGSRAYKVHIHTFHEFAGSLIREYPEAYGARIGGRPITDLEKVALIESILETPGIKTLRPSGNSTFYVAPIRNALSLMKREYITPDRLADIIESQRVLLNETPRLHEKGAHKGKVRGEYLEREKKLKRNEELLFVYRAYEAALAERGYFDYDDMIFETVGALEKNEDMLRSLQEKYLYILADEHQDVNGSQNRILELLSSFHARPNIFVVGDEKQSIYRFQGASLENFLYFEEKFPHTKTIALTENYRSAQEILDVAHALIQVDAGAAADLRVALTSETGKQGSIEETRLSHEAVEHEMLVSKIMGLIKGGVKEDEIAVIVRTNREVEELASYLRARGIPANASADGDILSHPITRSVRTLLAAIANPADERALFEVLQSGYTKILPSDLVTIAQSRSYNRSLASILADSDDLKLMNPDSVRTIMDVLEKARSMKGTHAPQRILAYALEASGLLRHVMELLPYDGGRVIRRMYDEVEAIVRQNKGGTLTDIEQMFSLYTEHNIPLDAPYIASHACAVSVMTAHKAKGLEFLHVFLPHLTDSRWGGKGRAEYFDIPITRRKVEMGEGDDERKLLYVALTRAKEGLHLSYADTNEEGRALIESRLLEDIPDEKIREEAGEVYEASFDHGAALRTPLPPISIDTELLRTTLTTRGLSVTALNNYLRSPWNYFYRNVLRIPEVQEESMQFGTILHNTLEKVMRHRREHEKNMPTATELKIYLEREISKLPLTHEEYVRFHERGLAALLTYLGATEKSFPHETKEEYKIEAMLQTGNPEMPDVLLTGTLDRLDFDEDGTLLRVVDYKTGKPKTRGYIEGTTKDSDGGYKRQLVFYALLLSLSGDERLQSRHGLLSFIEADERGKIHEEQYTVTDEEIEALKKTIASVALEIAQGAFLNAPCDPSTSDYCSLVEELRGGITEL